MSFSGSCHRVGGFDGDNEGDQLLEFQRGEGPEGLDIRGRGTLCGGVGAVGPE